MAPQAEPIPVPSPPALCANERVLFIVPNLQQNNALGKRDSFCLVVTQQRNIFIKINQMIAQKASQQRQAKNQGKGFMGRWKDQVAGSDMYIEYLQTLTVAGMLGESPESYSIDNAQIQQVGIKFQNSNVKSSQTPF